MIGRRALLAGGALVLLAPSAGRAQRAARAARLGVLLYSDPGSDPNMRAVRDELRALGYVEGHNLTIDYRYAEGEPSRLRGLAVELVQARPDVIFVLGGDVAPFVTAATSTIPVVIVASGDPVRAKLVRSLGAPGGNVTGVTLLSSDLAAKRLQLLKHAVPRLARVGVIWNPDHPDDELDETRTAARTLGVHVVSVEVRDAAGFDGAFQASVAAGVDGLIAVSSRITVRNRLAIGDFAVRQRLPLVGGWGLWAESGAVLSYGPDVDATVRRAAGYVDRVLKGARPADLPVQQPTKFELVINQKVARALGLVIPQALLVQADRVIS